MAVYVQFLRKTAATWTSDNTVLKAGQIGIETDTRLGKFGDGTTAWNSLSYMWDAQGTYTGNVTGQASSVDGEVALFSGTGGKTIKRSTLTGVPKLASGVQSGTAATINDLGAQTADYSAAGHKITNVTDPTSAQDAATKAYVDLAVTGLLDFKGATDCSANPNYPAASKGDAYVVSVAGRIGGALGKSVDVGDMYLATADNAGGTEASVGTSWAVLEHNLVGAALIANNLSDLANKATALANLSGQAAADFSMNSHKLTSVTDPTGAQDAATKNYVDTTHFEMSPARHGFLAWNYPNDIAAGNTLYTPAGTLHLVRFYTPVAITVTNIWSVVQAAGATLTNTGWCLYDTSGNLLQSTVASSGATLTQFQSVGAKSVAITSQAFAAGSSFYVGFWFTGTTMPTLVRSSNVNGILNVNLAAPNLRYATSSTGLTTAAPNPYAAQSTTNATGWWIGLS